MDNTAGTTPSIVLVPGHWLGAWAWDAVTAELHTRGFDAVAVTLPGLDPDDPARTSRTVADQAAAIRAAVDSASAGDSPVVVVAHSGAGAPTSVLLDQGPGAVTRVVYVDSGPSADGSASDASLPASASRRYRCRPSTSCAPVSTASTNAIWRSSGHAPCRSPVVSCGNRSGCTTTPAATSPPRSSPARTPPSS